MTKVQEERINSLKATNQRISDKLFSQCEKHSDFLNIIHSYSKQMEYDIGRNKNNITYISKYKHKSYNYIPLGFHRFSATMFNLKKYFAGEQIYNISSFLDCGCGIGDKLVYNSFQTSSNKKFFGLEICPESIKRKLSGISLISVRKMLSVLSKLFLISNRMFIIKNDILTFKHYDKFDLIYFYNPLYDVKLEQKFEQKLANEMRIGAYVLPFMTHNNGWENKDMSPFVAPAFKRIRTSSEGESITTYVYQKIAHLK